MKFGPIGHAGAVVAKEFRESPVLGADASKYGPDPSVVDDRALADRASSCFGWF